MWKSGKPSGATATVYRRELDISDAIHSVTYEKDGVRFQREAFASHPDQVMVFRYTADKPGALTGRVSLTDMHAGRISAEGGRLTVNGSLAGYRFDKGL